MKILVAGSNTRGAQELCLKHGAPKLYSFLNERSLIEKWDDKDLLMVDSGAHTWNKEVITTFAAPKKKKIEPAETFIRKYFDFFKAHCHKRMVFVEFDVYGHLPIEWIDQLYKRVMLLNPVAKFMRVYHPILDNGSLDTMRKWIDEGQDYIGIGNDSMGILDDIFMLTRDKVRLHGFAMTKMPLMERYPFFSCDSTSPLSSVIFGKYSVPPMKFKKRAEVIAEKSIECYHDDYERIENCIKELKICEKYVTDLWTLKGITWKELSWTEPALW